MQYHPVCEGLGKSHSFFIHVQIFLCVFVCPFLYLYVNALVTVVFMSVAEKCDNWNRTETPKLSNVASNNLYLDQTPILYRRLIWYKVFENEPNEKFPNMLTSSQAFMTVDTL